MSKWTWVPHSRVSSRGSCDVENVCLRNKYANQSDSLLAKSSKKIKPDPRCHEPYGSGGRQRGRRCASPLRVLTRGSSDRRHSSSYTREKSDLDNCQV